MASNMADDHMADGRTAVTGSSTTVQKVALTVGVVFALVGILGFIPGVTSHLDQISGAGVHSEAKLLGVFQVSVFHNLVHLAFGVAGIAMSRSMRLARLFLIGGGIIYLVLWLYGMVIDQTSSANFIPINSADNWLHFVLGAGMVVVGVLLGRGSTKDEI
ncbi:MAG: hypothetical protein QOE58_641 [Actinomycetota bacterium]|jgi:hypothetical protein|nr:hypothetical protein [Actinomycetota bacterium]